MNKGKIGLLLVLVLALALAGGLYTYLSGGNTKYVMAKAEIKAGTKIEQSNLASITVKSDIPGAIPVADYKTYVGSTALVTIPAGSIVMKSYASAQGGNLVDQNLGANMMAYTVQVDNVSGVTPDLHAGNYVAVFASTKAQLNAAPGAAPGAAGSQIDLDFQVGPAVKVLAIEQDKTLQNPTISGVTLEIPSNAGTTFDFATSFGKIHLAVVGAPTKDLNTPVTSPVLFKSLGLN